MNGNLTIFIANQNNELGRYLELDIGYGFNTFEVIDNMNYAVTIQANSPVMLGEVAFKDMQIINEFLECIRL